MSTLGSLAGGQNSGGEDTDALKGEGEEGQAPGLEVPTWVWGAAAGGVAAVSALGVTVWHFVGRRRRFAAARADVLAAVHEQSDLTPRNGTPRDFSPEEPGLDPKRVV